MNRQKKSDKSLLPEWLKIRQRLVSLELLKMRTEVVLLLFVATATLVLGSSSASPANFENKGEVVRVRRQDAADININVLQLLQALSQFIGNAGNAATNCVTQACFPFDAGRCLTCLALVGLAAVGK